MNEAGTVSDSWVNIANSAWWIGLIGLAAAALVYRSIASRPAGNDVMREISDRIHEGAMAFLKAEYMVLLPFLLVVAALLWLAIGTGTALAYLGGGVSSILAGLAGMQAATKANVRTSEAARAEGQASALQVAFNGGAVMGLSVASLGILGIGALFTLMWAEASGSEPRVFSEVISGFAMGASSIALFARVGGGIYTKAADVGADLVGKVEAGIPEDDPRNPATIADNVGDNVGDVAGMGADIFESYVGSIIATISIAVSSAAIAGANILPAMVLPLAYVVSGLAASLVGIVLLRVLARGNPATALRTVTIISAVLFLVFAYFITLNIPFTNLMADGGAYSALGPFFG